MILTYKIYLQLLTALDEHCNCTLERSTLNNAIFDHYINLYGNFIAENGRGDKRIFSVKHQAGNRIIKAEKKLFRNFMNQQVKQKIKKRKKICRK